MKIDTKHTQGPWMVDGFQDCVPNMVAARVDVICLFQGHERIKTKDIPANAKLIAAAPDMLEALHRLIAQCTLLAMSGHGNSEAAESFREIIRPVIARAEGKTK